jgi:hypothetical protein
LRCWHRTHACALVAAPREAGDAKELIINALRCGAKL